MAAAAGQADAQFAAARLLLAAGGTANAREAIDLLRSAAAQSHAPAQDMLADAAIQYRIAQQLADDPSGASPALDWLRRAADQGQHEAQLRLAIALAEGRGTAPDPAQAATWYAKAGDAGNGEALYRLALLYDDGIGVPRDTVKARDLIGQSAGLGNERAKEHLSRMLGPALPPPSSGDIFKGMR